MRVLFALGFVVVSSSLAEAQFATDRQPAGPAPITRTPTAAPAAPASPPSFSQVAATPVQPRPTVAPATNLHPWYVKPEHGQWMLCVKSYSGEMAKQFAENLAKDIRDTYKTPAYLFELGSEDKRKEEDRVKMETEKQRAEREKEFLLVADRMRAEAFAKGYDFQETKPKLRIPKIRYEEQYAVLVGGWKDMETARKALDVVRTWQPPVDKNLMDRGFVGGEAQKGQTTNLSGGYLNPFKLAMVVPNPSAPKTLSAEAGSDPLVIQMNNEEPMTVLKIQKPWTIVVKSFHAPLVDVRDKDASNVMNIRKLFNSRPDHLNKTAELGVNLAKMLRNSKPARLEDAEQHKLIQEAYVLHTLNGTLVCVGQFDSLEDPKLAATQQKLEAFRFHVKDKASIANREEIYPFDKLVGMKVK